MIDLIIRNVRLPDRPAHQAFDIGVGGGRILAIEPLEPPLATDAKVYDAQGRSRLRRPDRDAHPPRQVAHHRPLRAPSPPGPQPRQIRGAAQACHVGGGRAPARGTHPGAVYPARHDPDADAGGGGPRHRSAGLRGGAVARRRLPVGDRYRALRLPPGRPYRLPRHRRAHRREPQARRDGDRRCPPLRCRPGRPDRAHLRAGARVRRGHRHASGCGQHARWHEHPPRSRPD